MGYQEGELILSTDGRPALGQLHQPATPQDRWRKAGVRQDTSLSLLCSVPQEAEANEQGLNHEDCCTVCPKGARSELANVGAGPHHPQAHEDHAVWKLTHGEDPPTGPLLRAAMDEATRRKITIRTSGAVAGQRTPEGLAANAAESKRIQTTSRRRLAYAKRDMACAS